MASNRWDLGKPSMNGGFNPGFVSPLTVASGLGDSATLATIPQNSPPKTMAEQMEGDQDTTAK